MSLRVRVADCVAAAAEVWRVLPQEVLSRRRTADVLEPRQAAMLLAARLTDQPAARIAARLDRDHTTVLHGLARARERAARDDAFAARLDAAERLALTLAARRAARGVP